MRTALLHYWLTNMRGGEKVLAELGRLLPGADIFTHAYLPEPFGETSRSSLWGHRVIQSSIARLPLGRRHPQAYLPLMPMATRRLKLDGYDLIVSSESGPIKGIRKPPGSRHVCYCHTPMRYLWDCWDEYYRRASLPGKAAMRLFTPPLRRADLKSAESVDLFVANSRFVADRIKRIYGRDAEVVHPPVDVAFFSAATEPPAGGEPYYLYAGAKVQYKRLDLAQEACRRLGRRLVVAGGGAVSDEELRSLYAGARALLFPGLEDFGIVPVEAQAAGTPVIAYGAGGALETVADGVSGLFFPEQTVDSLVGAIEEFESRSWSADACRNNARRFAPEVFDSAMRRILGLGVPAATEANAKAEADAKMEGGRGC